MLRQTRLLSATSSRMISTRAAAVASSSSSLGKVVRFETANAESAASGTLTKVKKPLPSSARVVICGGGIIGNSVAYHLAKLGWKDVVLLEQGKIGCLTTWHAAETKLSDYGSKVYASLEAETGWRQCGSITVARKDSERLTHIKRNAAKAAAFGIKAEIISPSEVSKLYPMMRTDDLAGALWLPEDGVATSTDLCNAFSKGAKMNGVQIHEGVEVQKVFTKNGAVSGVRTNEGDIACDVFVNCGGLWSREIGKLSEPQVNIPLHAAEHFYIVTKNLQGVHPNLPVMRDPDGYTYFREWSGGLVAGGFEPKCKPCFHDAIPKPFEFELLPDDWDHFGVLMEQILHRIPSIESVEVRNMVNGPESFTADNQYVLGETPLIRKYFVAAGMNSSGIASSAGAGKALSEWIVAGQPTMDLWAIDIRRFAPFQNNKAFLRERTLETLGLHYAIPWPKRELESGRNVRRSPLHDRLQARNASFGSKFGWERANWFAPKGVEPVNVYSFKRQNWFEHAGREALNTRNNVSVFDQTSFAKFQVQGADAERFLQRTAAGNMAVPIGKVVYTGMLNNRGGYETDVTITRTAADTYFVVSPTAQAVRDLDWMNKSILPDERVSITDVTSAYAVIVVMGPNSRTLLSRLQSPKCDSPTSENSVFASKNFPFGTSQLVDLGFTTIRATRVTYVGELGWELYVPQEMACSLFDEILAAGKDLSVALGGYYAIDSLRIEKGYRAWGAELTSEVTPIEAGLSFAVDMNKGDFVGREALVAQKKSGVSKRLVSFMVDDGAEPGDHACMWGDEAIVRDGKVVGFITSASYGYAVGKTVCMGFVKNDSGVADPAFVMGGKYQIDIAGKLYNATPTLKPAYDPTNARVNA
ncbi:dimethylglycine dehydrogenase [Capsaspora owczarzaki ATCC 30864]|uniref:Dimethylglycine dehydrogenase n=1 Tax=Capsaspora owczarzaki (strain ATCC 30864) TaxID=595528 RepID=A0A0D2WWX4_CAPO3|nr:dimethylglycine dehydrogenase [Capsaspora owczarzaki ATCC 30864]KJE97128.1 dimethylglycine dehydrogenase [Capsaspora owczarzaki ATCC 30864]|eukprot:XP_004343467.2 dimethylglycine dehydrogenase [Capsaspora owczarzaki ATCC 30864]